MTEEKEEGKCSTQGPKEAKNVFGRDQDQEKGEGKNKRRTGKAIYERSDQSGKPR